MSASTAKDSTDEQLSSKAELSPFFDRIQLRVESYATLRNAGAKMSNVARSSAVEKRPLVSSDAPFYVVRGLYTDDNCQDLDVAMALQHGAYIPYADDAYTMVYVEGDTVSNTIFLDSACKTSQNEETTVLNTCQMRMKMYLSSAEEFAGNSPGLKGRFAYLPLIDSRMLSSEQIDLDISNVRHLIYQISFWAGSS